jgi:hypothetical protein
MDESTPQIQEPAPEQTADQQTDTPPSGGSEKLLPQSEVNRLIANARREGRESALKKPVATAAQQPTTSPQVATPATGNDLIAQMQARLEEMDMRLKFVPLAAKAGMDDALTDDMFDLFKLQRPEDPAGWIASKAQKFGIGRKSESAPILSPVQTTQQPAQPAAAPRPNISDRGSASPVDTRDSEGVVHTRPLESTGHDVDALILKHGRAKGLQMFQEKVLMALGNVRIKNPRG